MADIDEEAFMSSFGEEEEGIKSSSRSRGRRRGCWEKSMLTANVVLGMCTLPSIIALMMVSTYAFDASREAPEFSMQLAGYAGLVPDTSSNATDDDGDALADGHHHHAMAVVVSPVFSLKVHVDNPRHVHVLQPWCYNGGEVVVSYSGVALAWAHVPRFCIATRMLALPPPATTELFRVSPLGRGVGLSKDLGRRLASELRQGTAQVTASMKLFYQDKNKFPSRKYSGPSLHSFPLMLKGGDQIPSVEILA